MRVTIVTIFVSALSVLAPNLTAQSADVIRGTVTTDSGQAILAAEIIVTMAPNRDVFRTNSDSGGRYRLRIANGSGDYLVHIGAPNRRPFRKRVTRTAGGDTVFVVDASLSSTVQELEAVVVETRVPRPQRGAPEDVETGASEIFVDGVFGATAPGDRGNLAAQVGILPGVQVTPAGASVFGLGTDQMQATLNGMRFGGGEVPRDARTRVRLSTTTYDPARGGFSGGQIAVELEPGGIFVNSQAHVTLDRPRFQAGYPLTRALGGSITRSQVSLGSNGELKENALYYNTAGEVRRETAAAPVVTTASGLVLDLAGIHPDSAGAILETLSTMSVPFGNDTHSSRVTTSGTFIGRLDYKPFESAAYYNTNSTWGATVYARYVQAGALELSPTVTRGRGGERESVATMLTVTHAHYWRRGYLTETQSAVSHRSERTSPYLAVPEGRVFVSSVSGGEPRYAWLSFGGSQTLGAERRFLSWETTSTTQFYVRTGRTTHRVKFYAQSLFDGVVDTPGDHLGTFSFASVAALRANQPATFFRSLSGARTTGGQWSGVLAIGDLWRRSQTFSLLYGVRLEGNRFTKAPARNPEVERVFGVSNTHVPQGIDLSPRVGFTWVYSKKPDNTGRMTMSNLATTHRGPLGALRGGIGKFRNALPPEMLLPVIASTGLPGTQRDVLCIGPAVPVPDWGAFAVDRASVPTSCVGAASGFSGLTPPIRLYDPKYGPPHSWRGNLAWTSLLKKVDVTLDLVYSLDLNQPGAIDHNFTPEPRFVLAAEGNRPVFVSVNRIVPSTGVASPFEARVAPEYGPVLRLHSANRSVARQFSLILTPELSPTRFFLRGAYTLADVRSLRNGFDESTSGSPLQRDWGPAAFAKHQFRLQSGITWKQFVVSGYLGIYSGTPFTPLVAGDVNGDGLGYNDRAFVFGGGSPTDTATANGLASVMRAAPRAIRRCLQRQTGRIAGPNSCVGPWRAAMNATVVFPGNTIEKLFGIRNRAVVTLNLSNPLTGLDLLLHGDDARGWGSSARPDPLLFEVRGFDATTGSFRYQVNPRFGSTSPSRTTIRDPFRVTVDVAISLGRPMAEQQLDKWLRRGRSYPGTRLPADSLKRRYERNVPDFYRFIIMQTDSLLLSENQLDSLVARQRRYRARMDSLWTELASSFAGLGRDFNTAAALRQQEEAIDAGWEITRLDAQKLEEILSPIQLRLLPWPANWIYGLKQPARGIRFYM